MKRIQYLADIFILTGMALLCAMGFGFIGIAAGKVFFGIGMESYSEIMSNPEPGDQVTFLKLYNVMSTFGAWMVSAFFLAKLRGYRVFDFWKLQNPLSNRAWLYLLPLFISAAFVSAYLIDLNAKIEVPENIKSVFQRFNTGKLLSLMLEMNSVNALLVNLLVIAVAPAVFEEIFFRGTLQNLLSGLFRNNHIGIAVCSFLFALIHFNIDQIIPMFFLAMILGYSYFISGSLYISILIHLLNNTGAVLAYYYREKSEFARLISDDIYKPGLPVVLICLLVIVGCLYSLSKAGKNKVFNE